MEETMQKALSRAAEVISIAARVETEIDNGVRGLGKLIESRLETERDYRRIQCAAAVGTEAGGGLEAAREAAEGAAGALTEASLHLGALRVARANRAPDLCSRFDELKRALPEHEMQIRANFAQEYDTAAAAFAVVRGRRAGIERLLGAKLDLQDPPIAAVPASELADLATPYAKLAELRERIARIEIMNRAAHSVDDNRAYLLHGQSLAGYDSANIYVIVAEKGFDDCPFLAKVVDGTFDRGRMEFAVVFGYAKRVEEMTEPSVELASKKLMEIEKEERAVKEGREQRESLEAAGYFEQTTRRRDLEKLAERHYVPTTPEQIATGIKEASEEREAMGKGFEAEEAYAEKVRERRDKQAAELAKNRQQTEPPKKQWPEALH